MLPKYEHTQKGILWFYICLLSMLVSAGILIAMFLTTHYGEMLQKDKAGLWVGYISLGLTLPVMIWTTAMFYSLTVRVDNEFIHIIFGGWAFRKKYPLSSIRSCQTVRTDWSRGWGIRLYKDGWLYNIAGLDAVEIELDSGRKIAIGTDEPEKLAEAIREAMD